MGYQNIVTNNDDNMLYPEVRFRVVPFGPPITRDNEAHNPGRQKYTSESTHSYAQSEAFNFFWLDELMPINQRTEWQSGPPDNTAASDVCVDGAGFWTSPGGLNCDWDNASGAGSPQKIAGMSAVTKNDNLNLLYSWGIGGETSSTNQGMEYGVVGMSGYFKPDWDTSGSSSKSYSNIGLKHAYVVYKCDASDDDFGSFEAIKDVLFGGMEDVYSVGRSIFPEYMSGEFKWDQSQRKFTGYETNFPDGFNALQYFQENNIRAQGLIASSGLIERLRAREFPQDINLEMFFDFITEAINIDLNQKSGKTGAHNFQLDPESLSKRMRSKTKFTFLDLLNWYIEVNLVDYVQQMIPEGFDLSNYIGHNAREKVNNATASAKEIAVAMKTKVLGGTIQQNEVTGEWEGILPEGKYSVDKIPTNYPEIPVFLPGQAELLHISLQRLH